MYLVQISIQQTILSQTTIALIKQMLRSMISLRVVQSTQRDMDTSVFRTTSVTTAPSSLTARVSSTSVAGSESCIQRT